MVEQKKKKPYRKALRANHRTTADAGWYRIKKFIKEKAEEYGREVREIERFFPSSQMCHICGYINTITKDCNITRYPCGGCGALLDRDQNAAINILNRALDPGYRQKEWDEHRKKQSKEKVKKNSQCASESS